MVLLDSFARETIRKCSLGFLLDSRSFGQSDISLVCSADQLWTDILLLASPSLRAFYGDPVEDKAKSMDLHSKIEIQSTLTVVVKDISVATTRLIQPQWDSHDNLWTHVATA